MEQTKKPVRERLKEYFSTYFKKINLPFYFSMIALALALFLLDYFSKHWAYYALQDNKKVVLIPGVIDCLLVGNKGAAWGSLSGQSWFLISISMIASLFLMFFLFFRFHKYNAWIKVGITLMLPGAAGNLVDRIGYAAKAGVYQDGVIDFLHFTFWPSFPVCNVADYCLTTGIVVLVLGLIIELRVDNRKAVKDRKEAQANAKAPLDPKEEEKATQKEDDEMKKKLEKIEKNNYVIDSSASEEKKEDETKKEK